jgi:hypothetical protein
VLSITRTPLAGGIELLFSITRTPLDEGIGMPMEVDVLLMPEEPEPFDGMTTVSVVGELMLAVPEPCPQVGQSECIDLQPATTRPSKAPPMIQVRTNLFIFFPFPRWNLTIYPFAGRCRHAACSSCSTYIVFSSCQLR